MKATNLTRRKRFVVVGNVAANPYAGMAWMTMQIVAGLCRLGHEAYYFEVSGAWPYDPVRCCKVNDSEYALPYLAGVAESFGLGERWGYCRSYWDHAWFGQSKEHAEDLLLNADAVFNICGSTNFAKEGFKVGRLVYFGTDPVVHEIAYANGDPTVHDIIAVHEDVVSYGENIGTPHSPLPPLPNLRSRTRQPILLDLWEGVAPTRAEFTTVGNWQQDGLDLYFAGDTYRWSKHHEFLKIINLPQLLPSQPLELAMNLADPSSILHGFDERVMTMGVESTDRHLLQTHGWKLVNAPAFTTDPWKYRDYILHSRGEFTVARDLNVRLRSGWFSERSACYLAAGRPVVTQDTGFGTVIPTGRGLFAFNCMDDVLAAFDAITADYAAHSRAATEIAHEYFRAETVMEKVLLDLGV